MIPCPKVSGQGKSLLLVEGYATRNSLVSAWVGCPPAFISNLLQCCPYSDMSLRLQSAQLTNFRIRAGKGKGYNWIQLKLNTRF